MRKKLFIILSVSLGMLVTGCGKKHESITEMQEPISIEELSNLSASVQTTPEVTARTESAGVLPPASTSSVIETGLEELPPAGPYKPTNQEIQTALKNAGYYTALIDGKIGPLTKKAIEEFQQANNLKADGKIGPKTWAVLSKYINPQPQATTGITSKTNKKAR